MNVIKTLDEAKGELEKLAMEVNHATRFTRGEMRRIVAKVYSIQLAEKDREALVEFVVNYRKWEGANRAFIARSSSPYHLMLRYVFPSVEDRSNVSRYAGACDELKRMNVAPKDFGKALSENGGMTGLY